MLSQTNNTETVLTSLLSPNPESPLNEVQERVLTTLYKIKRKHSQDSVILLKNTHGRPIATTVIPQAEKGSSSASSSTVRQRSNFIEKIKEKIKCSDEFASADLIHQDASLIRRNEEHFLNSSKAAGLNIQGKFSIKTWQPSRLTCQWKLFVC